MQQPPYIVPLLQKQGQTEFPAGRATLDRATLDRAPPLARPGMPLVLTMPQRFVIGIMLLLASIGTKTLLRIHRGVDGAVMFYIGTWLYNDGDVIMAELFGISNAGFAGYSSQDALARIAVFVFYVSCYVTVVELIKLMWLQMKLCAFPRLKYVLKCRLCGRPDCLCVMQGRYMIRIYEEAIVFAPGEEGGDDIV